MEDVRLKGIEARLRTLMILQQQTRRQVEEIARDLATVRDLLSAARPRTP